MFHTVLRRATLTCLVVPGGLLVSCGSAASDNDISSGHVEVRVLDNSFRPIEVRVSVGTEVTFENGGRNDHNILPDTIRNDAELVSLLASTVDAAAWGVPSTDFRPGDTFSHVFDTPGSYSFYCSIHGSPGAGMYGVITVS